MSFVLIGFALIGALTLLVALWAVTVYNRLVRNRNLVREGWSGIDVQLKRRYDLIPNVVETVKGYAKHEQDTLARVVELRGAAAKAQDTGERALTENMITKGLRQLFALAEAYPDLKANSNFRDLQAQLAEVEEQIQLSRRYYNGAARDNNILVESFPSNVVARSFGFQPAAFFEIELATQRETPKVTF